MMMEFETYELIGDDVHLIYWTGYGEENVVRTISKTEFVDWLVKNDHVVDTGFVDAVMFDGVVMDRDYFLEVECPTELFEACCADLAPCHPSFFSLNYEFQLEMLLHRIILDIDWKVFLAQYPSFKLAEDV